MRQSIIDIVHSQVIASIKEEADLEKAARSNANIVFILTGNLITMDGYLKKLKAAGKTTFIHIDFIDGLSNTKSAIKYIAKIWKPAGIITTKSNLIKYAREEGLMTIQRLFLIDSGALVKGIEIAHNCKPDAIEILPGLMPSVIDKLTSMTTLPIIAGGLISTKEDILNGLSAGALAISSGDPKLWNLDL